MTRPHPARRIVPALVLALSPVLLPAQSASAEPSPPPPDEAFTIADARINYATGLATDPAHKVYWTATRGSRQGAVFAIGPDGRTLGVVTYAATPTSVEALAYDDSKLYIGDIGDPDKKRKKITVFVLDQPSPQGGRSAFRAHDFTYPDGPHDAAAMVVDAEGRLFVFTREEKAAVYQATPPFRSDQPNELRRVADAPAFVTDATRLADGSWALRGYQRLEVFAPGPYATVAQAGVPYQRRGESLTTSLNGKKLLLGSEGVAAPVLQTDVPNEMDQDVATPSATPPPAPEPTEGLETPGNRRGTLIALGLALVASIVAGAVALRRHDEPRATPKYVAGDGPEGEASPRGAAAGSRDADDAAWAPADADAPRDRGDEVSRER